MGETQVGIAVVGCGSTAHRRHLPVWRDLPGARLVAVVSRDSERRREAQARYGAAKALADWRELLTDPDVTAVDVCTPHPHHAEVAVALARAGKHVLCEKPLSTTLAEADAMLAAAREGGVILMPFLNMRLSGSALRTVDLVRTGAVGNPDLVRAIMAHGGPDRTDARRGWFLERSAGGGAVLDLGPHLFDLVAQVMRGAPTRIRATLRQAPAMEVESDGLVEVEYDDGAVAQLTLSWSLKAARETSMTVQGTQGTLRLQMLQVPPPSPSSSVAPLVLSRIGSEPAEVTYPEPSPSDEPCAVFVRAIRGQGAPVPAEAGVETMRYVDGCYRSHAQGGAWVRF